MVVSFYFLHRGINIIYLAVYYKLLYLYYNRKQR